jgi:hypothetical protein
MQIAEIYFKNDMLVLRDVDGSETPLSYEDALDLGEWIARRKRDLQERLRLRNEARSQEGKSQ